ncbi:MAG TPA: hypothetical protein VGH87_24555 [Polyangiaceae bacterium]
MNRLLAATAAASACSRPDTQSVTIAPLPTVPATTDTTTAPPPPPPTASATFTQPPQPPPPPDPSGYLVVDMLPAPARCLGVASASKTSAKFTRNGGSVVLDVIITLPTSGAAAGTKFTNAGASSAWSATIVASTFASSNTVAHVTLQPTTSGSVASASMGVQLQVSCGSRGNGTLGVNITYANPPSPGTVATVSLHDY